MISLMQEYTCRYGKHHASERLVAPLRKNPTTIPVVDFSDPPQCMPDYCKTEDTVSAYRYYYINEKASFAKWKNAKIPEWFNVGAAA